MLGLGDTTSSCRRLDDDEKMTVRITPQKQRGNPNITAVSESGLYALILRSNKPEARKFRKWVTSEVLPAIRKKGSYTAASADQMAGLIQSAVTEECR